MVSAINSAISALRAYKTQLEVASNNVANVNTEEFKKSETNLLEGVNGQVKAEIRRVDTPGHRYQELEGDQLVEKQASNVDLAEEFPRMIASQHAYEANMKVLQTQDKILGTTLDILG